MTTKTTLTALFVMLGLSACSSSAQLVRKDSLGGRVGLQGAYMPAMADARVLMTEHCDGRYVMKELGQSVEFRCVRGASADGTAVASRDAAKGL